MSEEVPNSVAAQAESTVEATAESRDPLKHQDGVIQQRKRPQSADAQRQERGGSNRRGVSRSWQDKQSAVGSRRRPNPRQGYRPPRHDSKHASNRGGGESSIHDRRTHKGRDKEFVNCVNSQIEPGTSYNEKPVHVPNLGQEGDPQMQALVEHFQNINENVLASQGTSGSSQSSSSAVNSNNSKECQEGLKLSRALDSDRGKDTSKTGKFKERDAKLKGPNRGGWRGKNYSQDRISYSYTRGGANNSISNVNKEMGIGNENNSNFHQMFYLSQADNYKDGKPMYRSPQCRQNSYYSHEPGMTEHSKYSRGQRREQRPEAKSSRPGRRGDFSYRSQQESVLRAISHLNPVLSSQASSLIEQLRNEAYECMVCCEGIRCKASIWSCQNCYHVFHLGCVRKWARSPAASVEVGEKSGWRCPACQNISSEIPSVYKCFCGKVTDPGWRRHEGITPHSCGELCGKKRDSLRCPHNCNQLCHPGPCPSCPVMITQACPCGRTTNRVRCGQGATVLCNLQCNKVLNCLTHRCKRICHPDPCGDCTVKVQQTCYCGKQEREALCGTGEPGGQNVDGKSGYFSCQDKCLRILDCGNHRCQGICHRGWCNKCLLKPQLFTRCPCGKTPLNNLLGEGNLRKSCLDPVPTCPLVCGKILPCSPQKEEDEADLPEQHRCKLLCHLGDCGPCDGMTTVKCRCGANTKEIPCIERHLEEYTCDQRCNKKKQCGRHRCNQKCCTDTDHRCELVCGKKLRCGYHKCLEPCHPGYCPPCLMSGFDELTCHCGASILYPPIPCGTLPPECNKPCSRAHSCSHPVTHSCHSEEVCPPCTVLTMKKCVGDHEVRNNIPCHVSHVSCGKVCGKDLRCGHKCLKICHKPPCLLEEEPCLQPCEIPRKECGHPCSSQCHVNKECPAVPCRVKVVVTCKCGRRSENFPCLQGGEKMAVAQAFQRLTTEALADKMKDLQSGHSVDTSSIMNVDSKKPRQLECNDDCALYERNRRVAEALNIENPDISHFSPFRYSAFLLAEAKQNLSFIKSVEDALENLVQTTLKMSSSQRCHSFSPMNSNQRRLVHELSMFYNCASRSYDQEPKRNTVVTATKNSYLPSVRLSAQIEREINPPPPHPIPYLPSQTEVQSKSSQPGEKKTKTWAQVPDYFADDFED